MKQIFKDAVRITIDLERSDLAELDKRAHAAERDRNRHIRMVLRDAGQFEPFGAIEADPRDIT